MSTISYLDNNDTVQVTNNFSEREGGYIIYELDGRPDDYFLPYNRVLPYDMEGDDLQGFIRDSNNGRIVHLSEVGNRAGYKVSKKKKKKT